MVLHCQLLDQEILALLPNKKVSRLEKKGAKAMAQAYKTAFTVGFKRCKSMAQAQLLGISVESLQANLFYRSLKDAMNENIKKFMKIS